MALYGPNKKISLDNPKANNTFSKGISSRAGTIRVSYDTIRITIQLT